MSEAMALERMIQMLATFEGYLTDTRVPYLAKYEKRSGFEKTGTQHGDLDLVGVGLDRRLLVAECKGYGSPESYQSWFSVNYFMAFTGFSLECFEQY